MAELAEALRALQAQLAEQLESARASSKAVDLDEPIGRLSRVDALQQQSMAKASRRRSELRVQQVAAALNRVDDGTYGECRRCDDPIPYKRLSARPESPYCVPCQTDIESGRL